MGRFAERFKQFERTFLLLKDAIEIKNPNLIEKAGIIKIFELAFELSWKTLKDYEEETEGFETPSPSKAIKRAYQTNIIADGRAWLEALNDRNLTVHTYNEATAMQVDQNIRNKYYPLIAALYDKLREVVAEESEDEECLD